jgi:short-subunit dehydrogenase
VAGLLEGRHALVTGAGRGIGASIAVKFAQAGADVALAARSVSQLEEVKARIEKLGRKALVIPTDMSDRDQVLHLVDTDMISEAIGTDPGIAGQARQSGAAEAVDACGGLRGSRAVPGK